MVPRRGNIQDDYIANTTTEKLLQKQEPDKVIDCDNAPISSSRGSGGSRQR